MGGRLSHHGRARSRSLGRATRILPTCPVRPGGYTLPAMPRVCYFTGVRTTTGNKIRIRGRAKHLGGVGTKVTSCTKRTFKPNLQTVTAVVDGKPKRIKVSARAIRQGLVIKPLKRKYAYTRKQQQETA